MGKETVQTNIQKAAGKIAKLQGPVVHTLLKDPRSNEKYWMF